MGLVWLGIVGLIAGLIARAVVPGKDPMNWWQTMLLGVVGSYVGGVIAAIFSTNRSILDFDNTRFIGSIVGAIIALLVWRWYKAR